jgi:hypothetical protein
MATLRNKTTEQGIIIRWVSHPDHARPSTYQVTSQAVDFLAEIGYEVPTAGDEIEIPWALCRPLRILGDLHFKSEQPNNVETDNVAKATTALIKELSDDQQQKLRSYIKMHPGFSNTMRSQLDSELSTSTRRKETNPDSEIQSPDSNTFNYSQEHSSSDNRNNPDPFIESSSIQLGKIIRKSNAGNMMMKRISGGGANLGKLPKSAIGKWTIAIRYNDAWWLCLTPQLWSKGYRNTFRKYCNQLEERTGFTNLRKIHRIKPAGKSGEFKGSVTNVSVEVTLGHIGIAYKGPYTIVVSSQFIIPDIRISVEIIDQYGAVLITRPIADSGTSAGDELDVTIRQITSDCGVGTCNGDIVTIPGNVSEPGMRVHAAVSEVHPDRITATVDALPENQRPCQGELITIESGISVQYDGIPLDLPDDLPIVNTRFTLLTTKIFPGSVRVSVTGMANHCGFSVGDELVVEVLEWTDTGGIAVHDKIPFLITGGRTVCDLPINVIVTEFTNGYVAAKFLGVAVDSDEKSIDELVTAGEKHFTTGEPQKAVRLFARAVDRAESDGNTNQVLDACAYETLAIATKYANTESYYDATTAIETALIELRDRALDESVYEALHNELIGYQCVLEAQRLLQEAGTASERIEALPLESEAKEQLRNAIEAFSSIHSMSIIPGFERERPHPLIHEALDKACEQLLFLPESIEKYLNAHIAPHRKT